MCVYVCVFYISMYVIKLYIIHAHTMYKLKTRYVKRNDRQCSKNNSGYNGAVGKQWFLISLFIMFLFSTSLHH